ncbi:class I SAM-dependent methyltransferase [Candidatus Binatia bacterium]|nr:class I SAM-dependent methyltransferase [Candidatus Binatia bacterium]
MRLSAYLPEGIPGLIAVWYSLVPGNLGRPAQRRLAGATHEALPPGAGVVVDLGCGPGWLAIELARMRPALRVVAIDLSPTMVRIARHHARRQNNVDVRCESGAAMSLDDGAADMLVSAESMHHWREPVRVLDEIHRVLRPGGRAWIFDGRNDFSPDDVRGFTLFGDRRPPGFVLGIMRGILGIHGFSNTQWETYVPDAVRQSRFGEANIAPFGIYRRVELAKPA